jgi:predicted amidophosphoribosyltransferase
MQKLCPKCKQTYTSYSYCTECRKEYNHNYQQKIKVTPKLHKAKHKRNMVLFKKYVDNLSDWYVKQLFNSNEKKQLTPEIINKKRESVRIKRVERIRTIERYKYYNYE